ncbi:hypothetical protein EMIT0111MI5_230082 [Burkholderia sp. IT-111MI5]
MYLPQWERLLRTRQVRIPARSRRRQPEDDDGRILSAARGECGSALARVPPLSRFR